MADIDIDVNPQQSPINISPNPQQNIIPVEVGEGSAPTYWGQILGDIDNQTDLKNALATKQDKLVSGTNIKTVNNTSLLGSGNITIDSLPSQSGQSGKFLTTDGTDASWATVDALPSQSGQSGKFLTTDGTDASWATLPVAPPILLSHFWSEHIINEMSYSRADTFGWHPGSTYTSAYNHLVDDYTNATAHSKYMGSNVVPVGSVINTNGILSNISSANYAQTNMKFNFSTADTWSIITKHKFTSVSSQNDGMMGILGGAYNINYYINSSNKVTVELSSNGSSYNIGTLSMINAVTIGEDFYLKSEFTGTAYNLYYGTDLSNMTLQATISSSTKVGSRENYFAFGVDESGNHTAWTGTIDLNGCSITMDNSVVWQGVNNLTYYVAPDGHKICLPDQEATVQNIYNATGNARYFILDTTNTRFKLPRWKHNKYQAKAPVVGNGTTLGLTNGNINGGLYGTTVNFTTAEPRAYNTPIGTDLGAISGWATTALGVTTDATKSGIEATLEEDDMYLYFYVGNFSQSATEQTAGLNAELFNGKVDLNLNNINPSNTAKSYFANLAMPSDVYDDLTLGVSGTTYTAPADGWYYLNKVAGTNGTWVNLINTNTNVISGRVATSSADTYFETVAAKKGDVIRIDYNATGTTNYFRFIYAVGSEWEAQ